MINCYLIGEQSTTESLRGYISSYPSTSFKGHSTTLSDSFNPIFSLRPNIVFIDAALLSNHEACIDRIRQYSSVILIARDTQKAFEAFEHLAFDYLMKPITFNRFVKSINKFDHLTQLALSLHFPRQQQAIESFYVKTDSKGYKEILIKCDELIYIQALQNYVVLHMENNKTFSCHNSMKEMEDNLIDSSFSRIHKSFIINESKITSIEGNMVTLNHSDDYRLFIGSTYRKAFFDRKNEKVFKKPKQSNQLINYARSLSVVSYFFLMIKEIFGISEAINYL